MMDFDYMTSANPLPPHLTYPRFLLGMDLKLATKVVYVVLLDAATHSWSEGWVDKHGRLYVAIPAADVARMINRTPATVRNAITELEGAGLVERQPTSHMTPDHIYIKLPNGGSTK